MDDAVLMRFLERVGDLCAQRGNFLFSQRSRFQLFRQGVAGHAFHYEIVHAGFFAHVVNDGDVWVAELGQCESFFAEATPCGFICKQSYRENFEGHIAVEPGIASAINFTHAACTQKRDDLVGADLRADQ